MFVISSRFLGSCSDLVPFMLFLGILIVPLFASFFVESIDEETSER